MAMVQGKEYGEQYRHTQAGEWEVTRDAWLSFTVEL